MAKEKEFKKVVKYTPLSKDVYQSALIMMLFVEFIYTFIAWITKAWEVMVVTNSVLFVAILLFMIANRKRIVRYVEVKE